MSGLDPMNPVVAVTEILLLLAGAALIGWLLGRLVRGGRVSTLRLAIAAKEKELNDCRSQKMPVTSVLAGGGASQNADVKPGSVPADPLLPALSHTDVPTMIDTSASVRSVIAPTPVTRTKAGEDDTPAEPAPAEIPIEIPPLGAPIPEAPPVLPPTTPTPAPATGNSEAAVLNRIAGRAGELNFDRIGRATPADADDLKDIVGIGPFLERKLHSVGIYTFRQVANFTAEDVKKVNEIIEFFPGRIEGDNWVGQADAFYRRKYGAVEPPAPGSPD